MVQEALGMKGGRHKINNVNICMPHNARLAIIDLHGVTVILIKKDHNDYFPIIFPDSLHAENAAPNK